MNKKESLVEATLLALQGKLKLEESKKTESVDISVDDFGNTIVETEKETVVVTDKQEPAIIPEETADVVEIPVEGTETIIPEDVVTDIEPVEGELIPEETLEENKKQHKIKYKSSNKLQEGVYAVEYISTFDELYSSSWGPAVRILDEIREADKEDELMDYLEAYGESEDTAIGRTELNDLLAYDWEVVFEALGISEDEDDDEDDDDLEESKKVNEATSNLDTRFDSRGSFYGKVKVDTGDNDDENKLYSYGTLVAEMKDGKPVVYGTYSQTTLRHIKEWLLQNGFKADSKSQIEKDYLVKDEKKEESLVQDASDKIIADNRNSGDSDVYTPFIAALVAEKADELGDDYSEWLDEEDIKEIAATISDNDSVFITLNEAIEEAIEDIVGRKRSDDHASPYFTESKKADNRFSSKTFNEALTRYYKSVNETVKECKVEKLNRSENSLKIEAKLVNVDNLEKTIRLEMKKVQAGKSFTKYELVERRLRKTESKEKKLTMMTFNNKENILECKYLVRK